MNQNYYKNALEINTRYAFSVVNQTTKLGGINNSKVILINIDNYNYYRTERPILEFKIRDEEGHIENNLYTSIHLILENVKNESYNMNEYVKKFMSFLKEKDIDIMKKKYKGDKEYMAGIVKVEDLMQDIDKVGLLYDYEEAKEMQIQGSYDYGVEQGIEKKTKEAAINLYLNGVSKKLITDSLKISKEQLEEYLKNVKNFS